MEQPRSVADVITQLLNEHTAPVAFGIPGVHNLPMWDAAHGPRVISVRHEQTAAYAADGVYRTTGQVASALVTSGPGAANTAAAFGEASASHSGLVVIASDVNSYLRHPDGARGILHEMADQSAIFRAFAEPSYQAWQPAEAVAYAAKAIAEAAGPPARPTYCGIATDVLAAEWEGRIPALPAIAQPRIDEQQFVALIEILQGATRPVLWLGGGSIDADGLIRTLASRIGAPIITTYAAHGVAAGHPFLIELPPHEPAVERILDEADVLLVLGSSFDGMNTKNWRIPLPDQRCAVTLDHTIERTIDWNALVHADVGVVVSRLLDELPTEDRTCWTQTDVRSAVIQELHDNPKTAQAIAMVEAVESGWPDDSAIITDMAVAGYWVGGYARQPRPRRLVYPVGWGTLGFALPAAIGPAALGIRTLAVCGDAGPMFALGELATVAQESLPITMLVVDDAGYGMLRFDQQVFGHTGSGMDLFTPDWELLGQSFGITTETISDVVQLSDALTRAAEANLQGQPRVIVWAAALHPPRTTSPRWHEA